MAASAHSPQQESKVDSTGRSSLVALTGNPNCGKTTLFNALTGLRAKVGNYAGVTVERKEGRLIGAPDGREVVLLDLPGTYSLSPRSMDERIARDILFRRVPEVPAPDLVVVVVDASNLQRNLYYATQVLEFGYPSILALNMVDVAKENGEEIDAVQLEKELGVPVIPLVASTGEGLDRLREAIARGLQTPVPAPIPDFLPDLPKDFREEWEALTRLLSPARTHPEGMGRVEALLYLGDERFADEAGAVARAEGVAAAAEARKRLEAADIDWRSAVIEARYARLAGVEEAVMIRFGAIQETFSDRVDHVLTHKIWGMVIFVGIMALMFQSIFTFAHYPMKLIEALVERLGGFVGGMIPKGDLHSLLVDGVISGVGNVIVFLPQILLLFFFIGLLEDTGYMARAAFLMDRLMSKVGLHGRSFIPMLSSFACAIPGIMATRTIDSPKDRLATILVAPLMSCSARLPVYTVLIAAVIPADRTVLGFIKLSALTMLCMYLLGIAAALLMAWLFKRTLLKGEPPMLIMELPPYKRPMVKTVLRDMWERAKLFLRRAGTVILGISILLWFLASYPRNATVQQRFDAERAAVKTAAFPGAATPQELEKAREKRLAELDQEESGEQLRRSFAGMAGRALEPIIAPLGFDWKIGIGIVASFAAREVFVSTMSTVYNVGASEAGESEEDTRALADTLKAQRRPDGSPLYTPLLAVTLMVFYVFALQCVSTVAVVRRETNGWKWPVFQWFYMGLLAWLAAFITWHGGRLLGLG